MPPILRPDPSEYLPAFGKYIALVPDLPNGAIIPFLEAQLAEFSALLRPLTDSAALTIHAPFAWSIRQVVGHMTDCERIFGCRALRLARGDQTPQAPFDQDAFMAAANFNEIPFDQLLATFDFLRRSHVLMLSHFSAAALAHWGVVNNHPATARAFAYVLAGHAKHHLDILRARLA